MKKLSKPLSLIIAAIMLFSCATTAFAAENISEQLWNANWENNADEINAAVKMTPGSNETERYISWYSAKDYGQVVLTSASSGKATFKATAKQTAQGDYLLTAVVTDLSYNTVYSYTCTDGESTYGPYAFATKGGNDFTAVYVTDVHVSEEEGKENSVRDQSYKFQTTLEAACATALSKGKSLDLILSAGDQASLGLRSEYTGFVANTFAKSVPVATTVGNHDRKNVDYRFFTAQPNEAKMSIKSYVGTDYWFVKGDALFLIMDSNNISMADHQNFIKQAVNANKNVKWRVAMFHHDLHGGRIPHRESENQFLRLMWAPLVDKYGIDLVLLGHSHFYTISNVIYNNETVAKTENGMTVTNPEGTIYMVSGSINRPKSDEDQPLGENIGHAVLTEERIYNLLDFSENSIAINSYTVESGQHIGSLTIEKTNAQGGHSYKSPASIYYGFVKFVSAVAGLLNNIGVYNDLAEKYDVHIDNFFSALTGR